MLIWQAIAHIHNSYSSLGQTMLHQTPKNDGSLGHGKCSPQKKATVTKFKGAHLLKWLAAYCVLHATEEKCASPCAVVPNLCSLAKVKTTEHGTVNSPCFSPLLPLVRH